LMSNIGFSVCHQITNKSSIFGVVNLIVCSRCAGIYIGFLLAFIYLFIRGKRKTEYPSPGIMIMGIIFIVIMALDGITSYLYLRETSNSIRFLTGLMAGSGLSLFLVPPVNYFIFKDLKHESIIKTNLEGISFLCLPFLVYIFLYFFRSIIYPFFSYIITFSIIFIFLSINFVLASMVLFRFIKVISRDKFYMKIFLSLFIALLLSGTQLIGLFYLHKAI
ncbi:MAG: DUF2085 domain-containing protein, partial [Actinomycetia bacterium]|nr:DUF2085 domain-containing protein [Actinomycetes bacterium]